MTTLTGSQPSEDTGTQWDVVVVGGAGHVGLPLSIALAARGARVLVCDISETAVAMVNAGKLPFLEDGAEPELARALDSGRLRATTDPASAGTADYRGPS